jgi:hypothetical protein
MQRRIASMMLPPKTANPEPPITFHFSPFTFYRLCSFVASLPGDSYA